MKEYLLYFLIMLPWMVHSQEYNNKIIPTPFGNVYASEMYQHDGYYVIQGIFGDNQSCIIKIDHDLNGSQNFLYDSTSFSRKPFNIINDTIYALTKNRFKDKGLELIKLGEDFKINGRKEIETPGEYNFPTSSTNNGTHLYNSFFYLQNNVYKYGLNKMDLDGQTQWTKSYETQCRYIYPWDIFYTHSNHLLTAYTITYEGKVGSFVHVLKVDTSGNVVWKSDTLKDTESGAAAAWMTELSDSNIFLTFKKNKFLDPEFFNFHPYPPAYIWLDKEGKKIREDVLKIDRDHEVEILELKAGKGDYFYLYGQLTAYNEDHFNDFYGFITKYANNGDTIWTHTYRHPAYNKKDYFHYIHDLIEEENGDLTVLGAIAPVGGKTEVWVFRVNSEGCFGTDSCEQFTLADRDISLPERSGLRYYPNPTTGRVMLEGLTAPGTYAIRIYSIDGRLIHSYVMRDPSEIDLSHLQSGVYLVNVTGERMNTTMKVIRQ